MRTLNEAEQSYLGTTDLEIFVVPGHTEEWFSCSVNGGEYCWFHQLFNPTAVVVVCIRLQPWSSARLPAGAWHTRIKDGAVLSVPVLGRSGDVTRFNSGQSE